jgi:hypothetical protein
MVTNHLGYISLIDVELLFLWRSCSSGVEILPLGNIAKNPFALE